ncbi:hypothetical protein RFI_19311, partial [Reticulomyxa filosa]
YKNHCCLFCFFPFLIFLHLSGLASKTKVVASQLGEKASVASSKVKEQLQDPELSNKLSQSASHSWTAVSSNVSSWWTSAQKSALLYIRTLVDENEDNGDIQLYNPDNSIKQQSGKYSGQALSSETFFERNNMPNASSAAKTGNGLNSQKSSGGYGSNVKRTIDQTKPTVVNSIKKNDNDNDLNGDDNDWGFQEEEQQREEEEEETKPEPEPGTELEQEQEQEQEQDDDDIDAILQNRPKNIKPLAKSQPQSQSSQRKKNDISEGVKNLNLKSSQNSGISRPTANVSKKDLATVDLDGFSDDEVPTANASNQQSEKDNKQKNSANTQNGKTVTLADDDDWGWN